MELINLRIQKCVELYFTPATYHGTGGPLTVSSQNYQPMAEEWMAAGVENGFNLTDANAYQTSSE